jgi:hypothetical protein
MRDQLRWAWWLDAYGGPWRAHMADAVWMVACVVWVMVVMLGLALVGSA